MYWRSFVTRLCNPALPVLYSNAATQLLNLLYRLKLNEISNKISTQLLAPLFTPIFIRPFRSQLYMKDDERKVLQLMVDLIEDYPTLFGVRRHVVFYFFLSRRL
jgi:hypothetical protein